jgi:hypothetical protein
MRTGSYALGQLRRSPRTALWLARDLAAAVRPGSVRAAGTG